jgi:hypothetical protein
MSLGTFSGGGLGFGVAFSLMDNFTGVANKIERSMKNLSVSSDEVADHVEGVTNRMKSGFAVLGASAAILAPFVANLDMASDFAESVQKNAVVFGKSVDIVNKFTNETAQAYGLSKNAALEAMGTYGNLFTSLGMGQKQAAEYSVSMTKLAADMASFNNTSIKDALDALRSGMLGESEPLQKFGVAITADLLKKKALAMGLAKTAKDELTPLMKMQATYAMVVEMTKNAQGDFMRNGDSYANTVRKMQASFDNLKTSLGQVLIEVITSLAGKIGFLMDAFKALADNPVGKFIMKTLLVVAALTAVVGTLILITNVLRYVLIQSAGAFAVSTQAKIIETIATKGLTAGMRSLAAAAWAALAPFLPFLLPVLALAAAFYAIYRVIQKATAAFESMPDTRKIDNLHWSAKAAVGSLMNLNNQGEGLIGWFRKLGGYVAVIKEVWNSWDGLTKTFMLSETLEDRLKQLGIYDQAIALATWVVRVKEFLYGVWTGIKEGAKAVWSVIKWVFTQIKTVIVKALTALGVEFDKNTSEVENWAYYGKIAGYVIIGILTLITIAFVVMAVAAIVAMLPIIIVIGLIVLAIWVVLWVVEKLTQAWEVVSQWVADMYNAGVNAISNLWDGAVSMWNGFIDWLWGLGAAVYDAGAALGNALWDGIKSIMGAIWDTIKAPFVAIGDWFSSGGDPLEHINMMVDEGSRVAGVIGNDLWKTGDMLGLTQALGLPKQSDILPQEGSLGALATDNKTRMATLTNFFSPAATEKDKNPSYIQTTINLDGNTLYKTMFEKQQQNDSRQ